MRDNTHLSWNSNKKWYCILKLYKSYFRFREFIWTKQAAKTKTKKLYRIQKYRSYFHYKTVDFTKHYCMCMKHNHGNMFHVYFHIPTMLNLTPCSFSAWGPDNAEHQNFRVTAITLCLCSLNNYKESNNWITVNSELDRMWKEIGVARLKLLPRQLPCLRKPWKSIVRSQFSAQDLNWVPHNYKTQILTLDPYFSVYSKEFGNSPDEKYMYKGADKSLSCSTSRCICLIVRIFCLMLVLLYI